MSNIPSSKEIVNLQTAKCELWHSEPTAVSVSGILELVEHNHRRNFNLWHEEDEARREDIGFKGVYEAKRAIDRYNQERNDFIEKIDYLLVEHLKPKSEGVPLNSETPGMIIDKLSILVLKEFHMKEEACRKSADKEHREECSRKLTVIKKQLRDIAQAFDQLIEDVVTGIRSFAIYYQFKMYNDSKLNPKLYLNNINPTPEEPVLE